MIKNVKSVVFLGYGDDKTPLLDMVRERGHTVAHTADKVYNLSDYDVVVSYGYREILPDTLLATARRPPINLHIAYLPYNRGSHPNFWSFVDSTPSGVTIHEIDSGIDTGPLLVQRYVNFDSSETTFATTYKRLIRELELLFIENLDSILNGSYAAVPQRGVGTYHSKKELPAVIKGWNANIAETVAILSLDSTTRRSRDMDIIDAIANVRARNNVNWMELLKLAVMLAPVDAKRVIRNINADDTRIAELFAKLGE